MAGFTDLVAQSQPALLGGGVSASATEGRTWLWRFVDVNDGAGDPIDLTAVTGTCAVVDVVALDFVGGVGEFTVGLGEADTVGLANGEDRARACKWSLVLDDGTDSVQVWGPSKSAFNILPEA